MRRPFIAAALACVLACQPSAPAIAQADAGVLAPAGGVPQVLGPTNVDMQWRPTPAQLELIPARTRAYFTARDGGRLEDAYAFFSPGQQATAPFAGWRDATAAFNAQAGAVVTRTLQKVTWYKDPPRARPGIYAAVDFDSDFSNLALHCGYVVWQEQPDGSFALVREEDNAVDKETASRLQPGELEQMRVRFRC